MGERVYPYGTGVDRAVLIPKGNVDTRGIWIPEVVWKVAEAVIYTWIQTVFQFHNVLHGFFAERGVGKAIM